MVFDKFLLVDLDNAIWYETPIITRKRNEERIFLLNKVLGIHISEGKEAINYLQEIIRRYKTHFQIPTPETQLKMIFEFLGIPNYEMLTFADSWFEIFLEYPPTIDFSFVSTLEKIKCKSKTIIGAYTSIETEHIKYVKQLLSLEGFLHLFDEIHMGNEMPFIPPSPLAFSHIPPPGQFNKKIVISANEYTLKSAILGGYHETFLWSKDNLQTVFRLIKDYNEIIVSITQI